MYLNTTGTTPYCRHPYLLELELGQSQEIKEWVQGELVINLYGDRGEILNHSLTPEKNSVRFTHGEKIMYPLSLENNIGMISTAEVYWEYDHEINPFDLGKICFLFCSDKLLINNIAITSFIMEKNSVRSERMVLCGQGKEKVKEKDEEKDKEKCEKTALSSGRWDIFYAKRQPR